MLNLNLTQTQSPPYNRAVDAHEADARRGAPSLAPGVEPVRVVLGRGVEGNRAVGHGVSHTLHDLSAEEAKAPGEPRADEDQKHDAHQHRLDEALHQLERDHGDDRQNDEARKPNTDAYHSRDNTMRTAPSAGAMKAVFCRSLYKSNIFC